MARPMLADPDLVADLKGGVEVVLLDGEGTFRWLAELPSWSQALRARDHCLRVSGKSAGSPEAPYRFHVKLGEPDVVLDDAPVLGRPTT